jgi:nucleoside-diphosphate-sugar epimerase
VDGDRFGDPVSTSPVERRARAPAPLYNVPVPSAPSTLRRVVFGAGMTGARAAELAVQRGDDVLAVVRSPARAEALRARGLSVTREPVVEVARRFVDARTHAIVCFPPDGTTDAALAPLLAGARAVTYVSSTAVYGDHEGALDDATPVTLTPSARRAAEMDYAAVGATILRAPGIYGPERGLHLRVVRGEHRIPGDGTNVVSRIHVDDLAALILACVAVRGETFVVGDLAPAPQIEVVRWICAEWGCPMPPFVPPGEVHETLRRNRRIDPRRALEVLGVTLAFPSYQIGMKRPRA